MDDYMTAREVAVLLKLSLTTIRRYTMKKEIPFHKLERAVRYKKSEVKEWFEMREAAKANKQDENQEGGLFTETEIGGEA